MTEQATLLPTATPATSGPLQPSAQSAAEGAAIRSFYSGFSARGLCLSFDNTSTNTYFALVTNHCARPSLINGKYYCHKR